MSYTGQYHSTDLGTQCRWRQHRPVDFPRSDQGRWNSHFNCCKISDQVRCREARKIVFFSDDPIMRELWRICLEHRREKDPMTRSAQRTGRPAVQGRNRTGSTIAFERASITNPGTHFGKARYRRKTGQNREPTPSHRHRSRSLQGVLHESFAPGNPNGAFRLPPTHILFTRPLGD